MTDRIHSLTVVVEKDLREDDDCEALVQAILMLRGVGAVHKHVSDVTSNMAEWRAKKELRDKLMKAFED